MTSIEILEANRGKRNEAEAAAGVLTSARKYVTEPRALELIGYCIEDLMAGRKSEIRRGGL